MKKAVTWTKGMFHSAHQILWDGQICGNLIFETWNNHAFGIMWQKNYHFRCNGFLNTTTTIYGDNHEELGTITFHIWQFRAIITLKNQVPFSWNYSNGWLNSWTVSNHQDTHFNFKASSSSGVVLGENLDNELLLLAGLYIKEFFTRLLLVFIVFLVFIAVLRA